ncbi:MAG: Ig-like domain-containing protein [Patescibacteria group bacterium]|nr:Ig-like domain-containing protein [Patescibacteria group bacterium]
MSKHTTQASTIDLRQAFTKQKEPKAHTEKKDFAQESAIFGDTFHPETIRFRITKLAKEKITASTLGKSALILALLALVFYLIPNQQPTEAIVPTMNTEQYVAITTDQVQAGEMAILRSTPVKPGSSVAVTIRRPDGQDILMSARANESGIAQMTLLGTNTEMAGVYTIRATAEAYISRDTTLQVNPTAISIKNSRFTVDKALAKADGKEEVSAAANIRDTFNNPIPNRKVQIVSSRNLDLISKNRDSTDQNGELTAKIRSITSGTSYLTAFDEETGQVLGKPLEVKFYATGETIGDLYNSQSLLTASPNDYQNNNLSGILDMLKNQNDNIDSNYTIDNVLAQQKARTTSKSRSLASYLAADITSPFSQSNVHHFEIDGIPETVKAGTSISSVVVRAVDSDGLPVTDYAGTVHFRSSDDSAVLPLDSKFETKNEGMRSFDLALTFVTPGTQTLIAEDVDDNSIFGKIENINVTGSKGLGTSAPVITSPVNDTTLSTSKIKMAGRAPINSLVSIYDNTKKLGEIIADENGRWVFTTPILFDGAHQLSAVATNTNNEISPVSEAIIINVDSTEPQPAQITLDPEEVNPQGKVEVTLESEKELKKVELIIDRRIIELTNSNPEEVKIYTGSFVAPKTRDSYDIDVILTDELDNSETYKGLATLRVKDLASTADDEKPSASLASVTDVKVINQGSTDITLAWRGVENADRYQIRYGEKEGDLAYSISVSSDQTRGKVDGLLSNVKYYFAVVALDKDGKASKIIDASKTTGQAKPTESYAYEDEIATLSSATPKVIASKKQPAGTIVAKKVIKVQLPKKTSDVGPESIAIFCVLTGLAAEITIRRKNNK